MIGYLSSHDTCHHMLRQGQEIVTRNRFVWLNVTANRGKDRSRTIKLYQLMSPVTIASPQFKDGHNW